MYLSYTSIGTSYSSIILLVRNKDDRQNAKWAKSNEQQCQLARRKSIMRERHQGKESPKDV